jgi:hypothetical protein
MMNNNWYTRQLEQIADMHGSLAAKSPAQIKGLIMRCVGIGVSDEAATKIASAAKTASEEAEIYQVLRESARLPAAAAKALARSMMPNR